MTHQPQSQPTATLSPDGKLLAVHVPMTFRKRGGRKVVVAPNGVAQTPQAWAPQKPRHDTTLVRALARAFRWQRMLDEGRYATVSDLARAEKLNTSFVAHALRLTLLAPDIVEAILDGRQSPTLQLQPLMRGFPVEWEKQRTIG